MPVKRIAVTGPESTGKSLLTLQLAEHFQTSWVPEFAREYIDHLDRPYEEQDILEIAKGQMKLEQEQILKAKDYFFSDTELIVTKIWSDVKYGRCHPWILDEINRNPYDLYLLCYIDIPWQADPQREHPHMRNELFRLYFNEINNRRLPFAIVKGLGDDRLKNALEAMRQFHLL
jgi:NadR type nicotinamide-nucleotide adenylyltransferase